MIEKMSILIIIKVIEKKTANLMDMIKKIKDLYALVKLNLVFSMISQIEVNKNKLYKFIDIRQMINFEVMKCYNLLFSLKGIKTNIGFYSFFPTLISFIVSIFFVYFSKFKRIENQINDIILAKNITNSEKKKYEQINDNIESKKEVNVFLIGEQHDNFSKIIESNILKKYKKRN